MTYMLAFLCDHNSSCTQIIIMPTTTTMWIKETNYMYLYSHCVLACRYT